MKAARTAALCWVFSIVRRNDRPSRGAPAGLSGGRHRQAAREARRNAVPRKGDTMGMAQAGDGFPTPATRQHIFSVHTVVHLKGAAAFFYSTYFYFFPNYATKEYSDKGKGLPVFRGRAPPFRCWKLID